MSCSISGKFSFTTIATSSTRKTSFVPYAFRVMYRSSPRHCAVALNLVLTRLFVALENSGSKNTTSALLTTWQCRPARPRVKTNVISTLNWRTYVGKHGQSNFIRLDMYYIVFFATSIISFLRIIDLFAENTTMFTTSSYFPYHASGSNYGAVCEHALQPSVSLKCCDPTNSKSTLATAYQTYVYWLRVAW
ncbi:hypothetical protein BDP27DRAFT_1428381 [Rhodocollybia butyracea]|uniref:Uncharacterized protein n=1 Tax=Rhodocollybia butyracea TaxID=206335 RepID=A0A9P5PF05_9AGAR|nr:hypothetical protein BDP27DRAFT_1428381 [Rhodocollybia butyracea]